MGVDLVHECLVCHVLGGEVCNVADGRALLARCCNSDVTPFDLLSVVTGPVVSPEVVRPAVERRIAVASHVLPGHGVVRKSEVLLVSDLDLEPLVVDECPESYVSVLVHGLIRKHQLNGQRAGDGSSAKRGAIYCAIEVGRPDGELPRAQDVFVGAVSWRITHRGTQGAAERQQDRQTRVTHLSLLVVCASTS